jgi:hypothetical protein
VDAWRFIKEKVLLEEAERRASAHAPEEAQRIQWLSRCAGLRVKAARDLTAPSMLPVAAKLLCDAVRFRAEAWALEHGKPESDVLGELPLDVRDHDVAEIDAMAPAELDRLVLELRRVERRLRRDTEARSVAHIRATRFGRVGAAVVLGVYLTTSLVANALAAPNIALRHHAVANGTFEVPMLVDGDRDKHKPVHIPGPTPSVEIDLNGVYALSSVRLTNRDDEHFDMSLPIRIETAERPGAWQELALQRIHFRTAVIDGNGRRARWVRISSGARELALNQVEVFGRFAGR